MTVILTGATGFIGRHVVDALAAGGDEVRCLTRGVTPADSRGGVTYHQADFTKSDLGLSPSVMQGARLVIHLGGATKAVSRADFMKANVDATARLLDAVAASGSSPRVVYVSSQAAAGPAMDAEHPKTESDPDAPIEDYGKSKLAAEREVKSRAGLEWTVVRPVAVYGPGDRDFLSIFDMVRRGVALYPGTRHSAINTVHVDDAVRGIISAARSPAAAGRTYFLGDDAARSWKEIYAVIAEVVGQAKFVEVKVPRGLVKLAGKAGDIFGAVTGKASLINSSKVMLAAPRYWLCSSERARAELGFSATTSLPEGMRATYDWYLRNRWL